LEWKWKLIEQNCTGCGICEDVCPHDAIQMTRQMAYPEAIVPRCVGCMACVQECPFDAVQVDQATVAPEPGENHVRQP
jgi:ferredoxin